MPLLNTSAVGLAPAEIRQAVPGDLPRLVAAADQVFRSPTKVGLGSMGHDYPLLFSGENASNLYLAEEPRDARTAPGPQAIIGHTGYTLREAMIQGRRVKVACLGAVFTMPPFRNQGLATRLLGAAVAGARAAGADLGLVSGARGLYASAGFDAYPAVRHYRLTRAHARPLAEDLVVEGYRPEALPDLARLQQQEPVHFVRSPEDWRRLLQARVVFFEPGAVYTIRRGGDRVAYLAVGRPFGDDGSHAGARVLEVGGDRQAIAAAALPLLDAIGIDALDVLLPTHDQSMEALATDLDWARDEMQLPFSARWWNPSLAQLPLPFYGLNYV